MVTSARNAVTSHFYPCMIILNLFESFEIILPIELDKVQVFLELSYIFHTFWGEHMNFMIHFMLMIKLHRGVCSFMEYLISGWYMLVLRLFFNFVLMILCLAAIV